MKRAIKRKSIEKKIIEKGTGEAADEDRKESTAESTEKIAEESIKESVEKSTEKIGEENRKENAAERTGKIEKETGEVPACVNFTYMVRCCDGSLYTGWTNHLEARVRAHNEGRGAKYTKSRRPVELVYWEKFGSKQEAMSREAAIKKLTKQEKEKLAVLFRAKTEGSLITK